MGLTPARRACAPSGWPVTFLLRKSDSAAKIDPLDAGLLEQIAGCALFEGDDDGRCGQQDRHCDRDRDGHDDSPMVTLKTVHVVGVPAARAVRYLRQCAHWADARRKMRLSSSLSRGIATPGRMVNPNFPCRCVGFLPPSRRRHRPVAPREWRGGGFRRPSCGRWRRYSQSTR